MLLASRRKPTTGSLEPTYTRASAIDEMARLRWRNKPLKAKSRTWLRGETDPQRPMAEQTVEAVRNREGGTKRAWDARVRGRFG